jgi:branched-chain amino acid transport system permease protein
MLFQQIVNGLSLGSIYALFAIGFTMVFGILRLMNFSHGDVFMFGTFISFTVLNTLNLGFLVAAPLALAMGGVLAMAVEILAYRPIREEGTTVAFVSAFGAAWIIRNGAQIFWGFRTYSYPSMFKLKFISFWGVQISLVNLLTFVLATICIVVFNIFLRYHKVGKAIRCLAQSIPVSSLMGIQINKTISMVYAIGGILGVAGGMLYASSYNVICISIGFWGLMKGFIAAVVGGFGNLNGALLGGLVLGLVESLGGAYISSAYRDAISLLMLILILVFRPNGLLGKEEIEKI